MQNDSGAGFDSVAAYYEVLSDSAARLKREGPLLEEWLDESPGKRVWDIACGTGLHAEFLANLKADVLALDASEPMIRHAQARRPNKRIRYQVADMRRLPDGTADLAVCLGNSLSLLENLGQAEAVVCEVAKRLAPGGLFCAQVINNAADGMNESRHRVELKETDAHSVIAVKNLVPQGDKTLLSISFFHESGGAYESVSETAVLLHLSIESFQAAAQKAALRVENIYGGYDKRAFDAVTSPDLIVVMVK